jgi:hypothetical protein
MEGENSRSFNYSKESDCPIKALWLSFASNPTGGPARWTAEEGYFAWPEYAQNTSSMLLFAKDGTLQQLVTGDRIDGNCTF